MQLFTIIFLHSITKNDMAAILMSGKNSSVTFAAIKDVIVPLIVDTLSGMLNVQKYLHTLM